MPQEEVDPEHPVQPAAERPAGPGIMVFCSSANVLYANESAHRFLKRLNQQENGHATDGALPVAIAELFDKITNVLKSNPTNSGWGQVEASRLVEGQNRALVLRAFGLPDRLGSDRSRVVLKMEEIIRSSESEAKPREPLPPSP
jgi:hypothetical protein